MRHSEFRIPNSEFILVFAVHRRTRIGDHVASEEVAEPKAVRYMGRPRTSGTLYNEASLPLGPFVAK